MTPSAKEIYDRYLSPTATDKKGRRYVFENGEPDHFKLLECILSNSDNSDFVNRFNEDAEFTVEVDDLVGAAMDLYNNDDNDSKDEK